MVAAKDIQTKHFINGEFVPSKSGKTWNLVNPATEESLVDVSEAQAEDVEAAIQAAKAALPAWSATPAKERARLLRKMGDLLKENVNTLAELQALEMGAPVIMGAAFAGGPAEAWYHAAALVLTELGKVSINNQGVLAMDVRQPFGVTAAIIPWNVPVGMFTNKAAPSVGAGNTIVIKSSEKAPLTSLHMALLVQQAGFPPGVINVVSGFGPVAGRALAESMIVRKISFTGSAPTGRLIQKMAAETNLKVVTLELGGKSPSIVFDDADIQQAAAHCAFSILINSGQICIANSRVYVQEGIYKEFSEAYRKAMTSQIGDPLQKTTTQGPQADKIQFDRVMSYIEAGKAEGANILTGGARATEKGYYVQPTVFTDVKEDAKINAEEIFGPVSILHSFKTEEEAIARANDTEQGLFAYVHSKDFEKAIRVAKRLEAGSVTINAPLMTTTDMPFGGYKASGIGRELGSGMLDSWLQHKSIYTLTR